MKVIDEKYNWDLFHNFESHEFICKCGCNELYISKQLMLMLDSAREITGIPFIVNSGYRCYTHNEEVGGSKSSYHMLGAACDIATTNENRFEILKALVEVGFKTILIYENFVHVDGRDNPLGIRIKF